MNIECFRFRKFSLLNFTFSYLRYAGIKQMFELCIFYTFYAMADDVVVAFSFNWCIFKMTLLDQRNLIRSNLFSAKFCQRFESLMYTLLTYQSIETGPESIIMYTTTTILMYRAKYLDLGLFVYMSKCKIFKHFKIKHYQTVAGITRFVCIHIEKWNHTLFIWSFQSKRMDSNRTFATS